MAGVPGFAGMGVWGGLLFGVEYNEGESQGVDMTKMADGDWAKFQGKLTQKEFMCRCGHCPESSGNNMEKEFLEKVYKARGDCGFPFVVSSGWRCANHKSERNKATPGTHNKGIAVDLQASGARAKALLSKGLAMKFGGLGVNQKGDRGGRFVHWDDGNTGRLWTY